MIKLNKTHYAVLGMLSICPMSGYNIRQMIKQSIGNFWSESDGQLYPALALLNKHGYVTCKSANKPGARENKIYTLTDKGKDELREWLALTPETHSVRNEAMLKLFFGANTTPEINFDHIENLRYQAKAMLAQLTAMRKQLISEEKDSAHLPYWLMCIDHGIQMNEARLSWSESIINNFKK